MVDGLQLSVEPEIMVSWVKENRGGMGSDRGDSFNMYNIDYNCENAPSIVDFEAYFNRPSVRDAIHVFPKEFAACNTSLLATLSQEFVTPPAYFIMPAILDAGVSIHLYSGNFDFLLNHIGTELTIQNMTWYVIIRS